MFETDLLVQNYISRHKEQINELENMTKQYNVTNQERAEHAVQSGHYIIGSIDQYGQFSISSNPAIHVDVNSAKNEAKRLAASNPGKSFVVLTLTMGFRAAGILEF